MSEGRLQYTVFIGLALVATILTGIAFFSNRLSFQRFFGSINPLVLVVIVSILGLILLSLLRSRAQFMIYARGDLKGVLISAGLAILLGVIITFVDRKIVFSADMNIRFPDSLAFYPAIGFIVEILFHVLPLALLVLSLSALFGEANLERIIWVSIMAISLIEPIYQAVPMLGEFPAWSAAYVGLHVFLINLIGLIMFRRYDFVTMYSFRLVYYLLWHILWGHIRLSLLF